MSGEPSSPVWRQQWQAIRAFKAFFASPKICRNVFFFFFVFFFILLFLFLYSFLFADILATLFSGRTFTEKQDLVRRDGPNATRASFVFKKAMLRRSRLVSANILFTIVEEQERESMSFLPQVEAGEFPPAALNEPPLRSKC